MMTFPFQRPFVIGVVHLAGTPGSPDAVPTSELLGRAAADARALADGGVDGLIVENFGDRPFHPERVPPETIATLALAVARVRNEAGSLPVGVNVLRNDARAALGLCAATGAEFLRVNVHTGAMVTDQGLIQGRAHETLRERQRLAPDAALPADVHAQPAAPPADARTLIQNKGSDTLVNVAQAWAEEYKNINPEVAIAVSGGGSGSTSWPASSHSSCFSSTDPCWPSSRCPSRDRKGGSRFR